MPHRNHPKCLHHHRDMHRYVPTDPYHKTKLTENRHQVIPPASPQHLAHQDSPPTQPNVKSALKRLSLSQHLLQQQLQLLRQHHLHLHTLHQHHRRLNQLEQPCRTHQLRLLVHNWSLLTRLLEAMFNSSLLLLVFSVPYLLVWLRCKG